MSTRPHFLHFLEGVNSGIVILVMLGSFIAQYFVFRTHTLDFEATTGRSIQLLTTKNEALEVRMNSVTVAEAALATDIENLKRQIDRLEDNIDRILERLR